MQSTNDLRVVSNRRLMAPSELKAEIHMSETASNLVVNSRKAVQRILRKQDSRMLIVVGPCSIHDTEAALEYARRLKSLSDAVEDQFCIIMRVYFEKPRTTIGWKGLINDPYLDGTYDVETGLRRGRKLLLDVNELGLPAATEFLDPVVPQYLADLVSWAAIGARTTESQTHREMASGLSMPVGFKNGTDGSLQIALDAMTSARHPHHFLGIDQEGFTSVVRTTGNEDAHVVLRGGNTRPNFDAESIADAAAKLTAAKLPPVLMVDCSHANSRKIHANQADVWHNLVAQRAEGSEALIGAMIESHLFEGNQPLKDPAQLRYGISITDACLGWEITEEMIQRGADVLRRHSRTGVAQPA